MRNFLSKKKLKCFIIVILVITVLICIGKIACISVNCRMENYDVSKTGIFTPSGIPLEYNWKFMGADNYAHWVYKLNKEEQNTISEELQNGKWNYACENDICNIKNISYGFLPFYIEFQDCFVAYYDCNSQKFIDDYTLVFGPEGYTTETIIYIYDNQSHNYYCVYWTI